MEYVHGVEFAVEAVATEALREALGSDASSAITLKVVSERIMLDAKHTEVTAAIAALPPAEPRFVFLKLPSRSVCFVYVCPLSSAVRLRMQYASCKSSVLAQLKALGADVERSFECDDAKEIAARLGEGGAATAAAVSPTVGSPTSGGSAPRPKRP
jgi:twinfilin-like protein